MLFQYYIQSLALRLRYLAIISTEVKDLLSINL